MAFAVDLSVHMSFDWFLYDRDLRHERVNHFLLLIHLLWPNKFYVRFCLDL